MKTCIFCHEEKPLNEFHMRKRPPIQPYAACMSCENEAYNRKPHKGYKAEVVELRNKAKELRKFSPEQDVEIAKRVNAGEKRNAIAKEYGVSPSAVGGAAKRGRSGLDKP